MQFDQSRESSEPPPLTFKVRDVFTVQLPRASISVHISGLYLPSRRCKATTFGSIRIRSTLIDCDCIWHDRKYPIVTPSLKGVSQYPLREYPCRIALSRHRETTAPSSVSI